MAEDLLAQWISRTSQLEDYKLYERGYVTACIADGATFFKFIMLMKAKD